MPSRLNPDAIRAKMKEAKITSLASLSTKSGISPATIDRIMHHRCGNCNSQTVKMLADALKCSPFDLYTEEALTEGTAIAAAVAVADAVAEAVNEAVNAVVSEVAPEAAPQEVAAAVPNEIPVAPPPALDLVAYFDYLKTSHESEIKTLTTAYEDRIKHDTTNHVRLVRILCSIIGVLSVSIIWLLIK